MNSRETDEFELKRNVAASIEILLSSIPSGEVLKLSSQSSSKLSSLSLKFAEIHYEQSLADLFYQCVLSDRTSLVCRVWRTSNDFRVRRDSASSNSTIPDC